MKSLEQVWTLDLASAWLGQSVSLCGGRPSKNSKEYNSTVYDTNSIPMLSGWAECRLIRWKQAAQKI